MLWRRKLSMQTVKRKHLFFRIFIQLDRVNFKGHHSVTLELAVDHNRACHCFNCIHESFIRFHELQVDALVAAEVDLERRCEDDHDVYVDSLELVACHVEGFDCVLHGKVAGAQEFYHR
jgi:hypothetical protein